ncbi:MAG TPA: Ig-like domain-containing protein [Fibrobacteria bacterium]|nr:Ig-like domain-containing protein [Fibrobacteria bacterium]
MTDRRWQFLLAASLLYGCARQVAPAGGPVDTTPPRLLAAFPDSGAVRVDPKSTFRLHFSEWVDPTTVRAAVSLAPVGQKAPDIKVDGADVTIHPHEPLDSPATYVLRIQPGLADWHKAGTKTLQEIPFATGDRIDSGRVLVRMWTGSDTLPPVPVRGRLGAWPLDSAVRSKLARLLRRKDSTGWLSQAPRPEREKPWRWTWADSTGLADLRFLPPGRWRLAAWDDVDKDNFWRPGEENISWLGDVVEVSPVWTDSFFVRLVRQDTGLPALPMDTTVDTLRVRDSLAMDSVARRWEGLPEDSTGWAYLSQDSLPASWKGRHVRIRVWPLFRKARPRLSPSGSAVVRLVPGKWTGEAWSYRDSAGSAPGVADRSGSRRSDPWCVVPPFEIDRQDSISLRLDCAVRRPAADTGKAAR